MGSKNLKAVALRGTKGVSGIKDFPAFLAATTAAKKVLANFSDLPGDTRITIKQTNEESIHQHDAYAERKATLAELVVELQEEGTNNRS